MTAHVVSKATFVLMVGKLRLEIYTGFERALLAEVIQVFQVDILGQQLNEVTRNVDAAEQRSVRNTAWGCTGERTAVLCLN
jgi:hypothetical protein